MNTNVNRNIYPNQQTDRRTSTEQTQQQSPLSREEAVLVRTLREENGSSAEWATAPFGNEFDDLPPAIRYCLWAQSELQRAFFARQLVDVRRGTPNAHSIDSLMGSMRPGLGQGADLSLGNIIDNLEEINELMSSETQPTDAIFRLMMEGMCRIDPLTRNSTIEANNGQAISADRPDASIWLLSYSDPEAGEIFDRFGQAIERIRQFNERLIDSLAIPHEPSAANRE